MSNDDHTQCKLENNLKELFYSCDRVFGMHYTCYCVRSPRFRQHTSPPHCQRKQVVSVPHFNRRQRLDHIHIVHLKDFLCTQSCFYLSFWHAPHSLLHLFSAFSETYHLVPLTVIGQVVHSTRSNRKFLVQLFSINQGSQIETSPVSNFSTNQWDQIIHMGIRGSQPVHPVSKTQLRG